MPFVWLGLGGNLGDVRQAMSSALEMLDAEGSISVLQVSAIYKTPPWGLEDQPWFLNCCAQIETDLTPEQLLEVCQTAERAGNRVRDIRWGPRTIDIDILVYEGVDQVEQRLTIPHPRMLERAFVLVPLAEIAPQLMVAGKNVSDHAGSIDSTGVEEVETGADWRRSTRL